MRYAFKQISKWKVFISGIVIFILLSFFYVNGVENNPVKIKNGIGNSEILWDNWGVPHIFAQDNEGLFYACGWAQMQSHGDLILKLYGEARGKGAEYWGEANLKSDIFIRTMGVPKRAREWFNFYDSTFKHYLEAFVAGMNDYAAKNKEKIDPLYQVVLPVTVEDILAHTQRVLHVAFMGMVETLSIRGWEQAGSNAWAIAPSHSESGNSLLLTNPHLPWSGFYLFFESQLNAPGLNSYGITFVGMPLHIMAFNDRLGWTHTVNVHDGADLFELKLDNGGYLLDGEKKDFDVEKQVIKIKNNDGTMREQELIIDHSIFGPVVSKKNNKALALKIAGFDRPFIWQQRWDMAHAKNFKEFEAALKQLQEPMLNVIYADRDGHIMIMHNAVLPKRNSGDFYYWKGIVPGYSKDMAWNEYHTYEDLPKLLDPPNGWVQNANQPIWTSTYPLQLKSEDYVKYLTIPESGYGNLSIDAFRTIRSMRLLYEDQKISLDEMVKYAHSTRMELADRLMDDLKGAIQEYGTDQSREAFNVLEAWDRSTEQDSRGGVLFEAWIKELGPDFFEKKWEAANPFSTPDGLKNRKEGALALEKAAEKIKKQYGKLDVPWGNVYRIKYENKDLPGNGGPGRLGIFRTMYYFPEDGVLNLVSGDTYIAAVEFSNPVKAKVVLGYGNASQKNSKHRFDQIELVKDKKLRQAWLTKKDIESHLEKREVFIK